MKRAIALALLLTAVAHAQNFRWTARFEADDDIFGPHPFGKPDGLIGVIGVDLYEGTTVPKVLVYLDPWLDIDNFRVGFVRDVASQGNSIEDLLLPGLYHDLPDGYADNLEGREVAIFPTWILNGFSHNGAMYRSEFGAPVAWTGTPPSLPEPGLWATLMAFVCLGFAWSRRCYPDQS